MDQRSHVTIILAVFVAVSSVPAAVQATYAGPAQIAGAAIDVEVATALAVVPDGKVPVQAGAPLLPSVAGRSSASTPAQVSLVVPGPGLALPGFLPPLAAAAFDVGWLAMILAAAPVAPLAWAVHGAERYRRDVDDASRRRRGWWHGVVALLIVAYLVTLGQALWVVGPAAWTTYPVAESALLIHLQFFGLVVAGTAAALLARDSVERVHERRLSSAKDRQHHLEQLLDLAPDAMLVVGSDGVIANANKQAELVFGAARAGLVGRHIEALIDGGDIGFGSRLGDGSARRETSALVDGQAVVANRADGTSFRADISLSPIETRDGASIVISVKDVSAALEAAQEREQLLKALRTANEEMEGLVAELARSNDDLARFATVASHDLQEPLRKVTSYVTLLENRYADIIDDRGRTYIAFAADGARRMQDLIKDLLAYSRVGQGERPMEDVDLAGAVQDSLDDLQPVVEAAGAVVEVGPLPTIRGNPVEMRILMHNLLSNALKFIHPERIPRVDVSARRGDEGWIVSVEDNGIGIEPGHQERIFDVFHRLHARDRYDGTGVGLALCRRIMEEHSGQIEVASAPGEGAVFSLRWPDRRS